MENQVESKVVQKELGDGITECKRWIEEINESKRLFKEYWKHCDDVMSRYKDDDDVQTHQHRLEAQRTRKYNVLWSMTETMKPLVYERAPVPYISRRHSDKDPVARDAGLVIERGMNYDLDGDELHNALRAARDDFILVSRGVIWPRYKPEMRLRKSEHRTYLQPRERAPKGVELQKDEVGRYYHEEYYAKVGEEIDWDYVHYSSFLHGTASQWKYVPWVARKVEMTRQQLIERFGEEIGKQVPLTINNKQKEGDIVRNSDMTDDELGLFAKAEVWEIWVKEGRKVLWICPEWSKGLLDKKDDFLNLREFFPCPKPAYGLLTNDTLIPKPEYLVWKGIAQELDDITNRLKMLVQAMRVVGVYDKSTGDKLRRITTHTAENEMIGVDNWAMFAEKGGIKGMIDFLPVDQVSAVVERLYAARQQLLKELYDITGISDIVRGASDPRETARAQQIKGNFAGKRIGSKQQEFIRLADEALEIHAQIMCHHYSDRTLLQISSAEQTLTQPGTNQFDPQRFAAALSLLRDAPLARFRIKVDEKSLATEDILEDRAQRQEYLMGIAQLLQSGTMMAKENPATAALMGELLLFAVRGFPNARSTEAALEASIQQMQDAGPPPKEEPPPRGKPPEELQAEIQMFQAKLELDQRRLAMEEQKALKEYELKQGEFQNFNKFRQLELDLKGQRDRGELTINAEKTDLERKKHSDLYALELGKLQATTAVDLKKLAQEGSLRYEEIESRNKVEAGKLLMQSEKESREADDKAAEREERRVSEENSKAEYQKIMSGIQDLMKKSQEGSEASTESLEKILQTITDQQQTIMKTLTSPRKVVRNKDGRVERVEVDSGEE